MFVGVRAQPVPDGFVMNGQLTKDLSRVGLQLSEKLFKKRFVKDRARRGGPHLMNAAFGRERESCENHRVVVVLRTIRYSYSIGNRVRLIVVGSEGINLYIEIAPMSVLFACAVPACFDLHPVGYVSRS